MARVYLRKYELSIYISEALNDNLTSSVLSEQFFSASGSFDNFLEGGIDPFKEKFAPSALLGSATDFDGVGGAYQDFLSETELAINITDLHIEASISYKSTNTDSGGQQTTISVYNMSPHTIEKIRKDSSILLKAGYEKDTLLPLIFSGQIVTVSTEKVGENMITKMVCSDSGLGLRNIRASMSFDEGVSYKTVINTLLSELSSKGIPVGGFNKSTSALEEKVINGLDMTNFAALNDEMKNGYNVEGNVFEALQEVVKVIQFRAYVVLGRIYVESIAEPERTSSTKIYQENVKGSIRRLADSTANTLRGSESKSGIRISTFLNGDIAANKFAEVTYGEYEGKYKITSLKHTLGYEQGNWDTVIDCLPVGG